MKKAMITIEVLISLMILLIVIVTSSSAIKFFHMTSEKKHRYENLYISALSIKDKLSPVLCQDYIQTEGEINGYSYTAACEKVKSLRTYVKSFEQDDPEGNVGADIIHLHKVTMSLQKEEFEKTYIYYTHTIEKSSI